MLGVPVTAAAASTLLCLTLNLVYTASAAPAEIPPIPFFRSRYQPVSAECPTAEPLIRPALGITAAEQNYITARKDVADGALAAWLRRQSVDFDISSLPTLGLTTSGGGYRSLLVGAGVVQGLDSRDTNLSTGGLYQALTYHAGLSGGSWLLSSMAGNDWPTVSYLRDNLWTASFAYSLLVPANLLSWRGLTEYGVIVDEILAKEKAGFDTTLVDPYGRLLSYQLLEASHGGSDVRLSSLAEMGNFSNHNVPYPIITTIGVHSSVGECAPSRSAPIFEFHPFEYGSWDAGIGAFAQSRYMGSTLSNGQPTGPRDCVARYDNLGYIMGTSSSLFNEICAVVGAENETLAGTLEGILPHQSSFRDLFGLYRNPFRGYAGAPAVADDDYLTLADGGETLQNNPIWPFIQDAGRRGVDVLLVNDNSADTVDDYPSGVEIQQTYQRAQAVGLSRMPYIPPLTTFLDEGLNKRATFFGCASSRQQQRQQSPAAPDTLMIVYLPNAEYTFPSNVPTVQLAYPSFETAAMIANGGQVAAQGGDPGWPLCLACALKVRDDWGTLPAGCRACFEKHCYYEPAHEEAPDAQMKYANATLS